MGLSWWTSVGRLHPKDYPLGTLGYVDKTLVHCTPEDPQGVPYSPEDLERLRKQFIASRMRMFEDVVYGQFGYLNRPREQANGEPHRGYPSSGLRMPWSNSRGQHTHSNPPPLIRRSVRFFTQHQR